MAYSKAKLKSNGDRASPCLRPFIIGNAPDKCTRSEYLGTAVTNQNFLHAVIIIRLQFSHLTSRLLLEK
jgi:hypothetical protein